MPSEHDCLLACTHKSEATTAILEAAKARGSVAVCLIPAPSHAERCPPQLQEVQQGHAPLCVFECPFICRVGADFALEVSLIYEPDGALLRSLYFPCP